MLLGHFEQEYDAGNWKGATENGCRTSIQIALQKSGNPESEYYLVINDIAGERFEEMLRKEKEYNEIQAPLAQANNILFLYDLIAWRQLIALLKKSQSRDVSQDKKDGLEMSILKEYDRQAAKGRAITDSYTLLIGLIDRIKSTNVNEKLIDRTFILSIPKCDLYTGDGMFLSKWIKDLKTKNYVYNIENTIYTSSWDFPEIEKDNVFDTALNRIREISDMASDAIKDLARSKEKNQATKVLAEQIAENVDSTLVLLEKTFKEVKVIPVSALGQSPEPNDDAEKAFHVKPNPLFSEALFLLPMINMYNEEQETFGTEDK
jgi:hypothetical protein